MGSRLGHDLGPEGGEQMSDEDSQGDVRTIRSRAGPKNSTDIISLWRGLTLFDRFETLLIVGCLALALWGWYALGQMRERPLLHSRTTVTQLKSREYEGGTADLIWMHIESQPVMYVVTPSFMGERPKTGDAIDVEYRVGRDKTIFVERVTRSAKP